VVIWNKKKKMFFIFYVGPPKIAIFMKKFFMPPIIKCRGHYFMAYASVSVNIPSIIGQTPGSMDPIFLWLIGVTRKVPFDDQLIQMAAILDFGFRRLQDKRLGQLIRFLCGSLGVTRGRFLSMIGSAAHPRWPLSWISFPSIRGQTPGSIDPIFLWLIGGD
jgi:hypothetical protein